MHEINFAVFSLTPVTFLFPFFFSSRKMKVKFASEYVISSFLHSLSVLNKQSRHFLLKLIFDLWFFFSSFFLFLLLSVRLALLQLLTECIASCMDKTSRHLMEPSLGLFSLHQNNFSLVAEHKFPAHLDDALNLLFTVSASRPFPLDSWKAFVVMINKVHPKAWLWTSSFSVSFSII